MVQSERDRKLFGPGPKRILALDGGGIRGIVSLAFLERIEVLLSERAGRPMVLADYYDLIGGTSTGAIIATGLSLGMKVSTLIDLYMSLSKAGFRGQFSPGGILFPKFRTRPLYREIHRQVGDETLGSAKLRTGLAIVAKRIDTGSLWVFHNHPRGPYYETNRHWLLARLIRASTAAPTFFAPERIEVAPGVVGTFVDGGVSPHNNPGLLLFMLATIGGYGFRWPIGADILLLTSVGTGHQPLTPRMIPRAWSLTLGQAVHALTSVIDDGSALGQGLLQWFGTTPTPHLVDSEIGDLSGDHLGPAPILHYQRYTMELSAAWMERELAILLGERELRLLNRIDRPKALPRLLDLSRRAAERQVKAEHFPRGFDTNTQEAPKGSQPLR